MPKPNRIVIQVNGWYVGRRIQSVFSHRSEVLSELQLDSTSDGGILETALHKAVL